MLTIVKDDIRACQLLRRSCEKECLARLFKALLKYLIIT